MSALGGSYVTCLKCLYAYLLRRELSAAAAPCRLGGQKAEVSRRSMRRIRDTLWLKPQNGGGFPQNVEKLQNFEYNSVLSITLIMARVLEYIFLIF